jgi:hypothetical protein
MAHVTYKVVRHDDGWAYTVNGVFSESFPTHAQALGAARRAAAEQRQPEPARTWSGWEAVLGKDRAPRKHRASSAI